MRLPSSVVWICLACVPADLICGQAELWPTHGHPHIRPTTHTLHHPEVPEHTVCQFHNLIAHGGQLIYAYEGSAPPELPLIWQHHQFGGRPGPMLQLVMQPFAEVLERTSRGRVHLEELASITWRPWTKNLYHSVGETLVTAYQHGCTYFKLCTHAELTAKLTLVFNDLANTNSMEVEWAKGLPPAAEAAACLGKRRVEIQAPRSFNQTWVLQEALVGITPHDRAYGYNHSHYDVFTALPKDLADGFRNAISTCLGIPYLTPGRRKPYKVSLVNRSTLGGRHMLNADTMVTRMNALPDFEARLEYVDGKSMREQFRIFSQSDIIVYVHGAMMGNFAFMSPDAVVIEYAFHLGDSHLHGFSMQLLDDLSVPASFIGIGPSSQEFIIPKLEHFLRQPAFQQMTIRQKVQMLESRNCDPAYKAPCNHMGEFMIQGEWEVLRPVIELAAQLVESGRHRFLILDKDNGFKALQHRHPETGARAGVEFQA